MLAEGSTGHVEELEHVIRARARGRIYKTEEDKPLTHKLGALADEDGADECQDEIPEAT